MTTFARFIRQWSPAVLAAGIVVAGGAAPWPVQPDAAAACVRFVTPGTASAGEWLPALAYRHRERQGPIELRLDGRPVAHRLLRYAAAATPEVIELFLTVGVPSSTRAGRHEISLHEPAGPGGSGAERLAVNTIVVGP